MTTQKQSIDLSFSAILKVALVALTLVFLYLIKDVLAILFLAIIVASALAPLGEFFERFYIPRVVSVLITYLVFIGVMVGVFYLIIPPLIDELKELALVVPDYYETVSKQVFKTTRGISPDYAKSAQDFLINFGDKIKSFTAGVFGAVSEIFGGVVAFGAILVISFYLAIQKKGVEEFLRLVTPEANERYIINLWLRVEKKLSKWMQGQLLLAFIMGVSVFVGLWFIGVPYALLLGFIAAIFEILPIAGPALSALAGISVAVLASPMLALFTLVFYVILQQVENHVLVPILMKRATGLNPVVVIIALLVGAKLGGVMGMLIAVPIMTIISELLEDFVKQKSSHKNNGERA